LLLRFVVSFASSLPKVCPNCFLESCAWADWRRCLAWWVFMAACLRSDSLTMLYLSNMLRVLWPEIDIATGSGTPSRTISRTALRRRSWKINPMYFKLSSLPFP